MAQRIYPEQFNLITSIDEIGVMLDIDRIVGEDLFSYKKRLLESGKKVANSSYMGLINGINRELGLSQKEIININLKEIYNGDLTDINFEHTDFIVSDNRYYEGIIDGVNTKISGNKLTSATHLWPDNYLVGLTLIINNQEFKVISNTYNSIIVDSVFNSLFVGETFILRTVLKVNGLIGLGVILNGDKYEVISNTENTFTLNKKIVFKTTNPTFKFVLNRPRVLITTSRIILYKEYLNEDNYQLDLVVNLHENNLTHRGLVKEINANSSYFYAEDLIPYDSELKAFTLIQSDSDIKVFQETIPSTKFFKLKNDNIKPGTFKFSEINIFGREDDELDEEIFGPYYCTNYLSGIIKTNMLPSGNGTVAYTYMDFPFKVHHAPAIILSLADSESDQVLFSQKEKTLYDDFRNRFVSSQPKADMIEYIAELIKTSKQAWGE